MSVSRDGDRLLMLWTDEVWVDVPAGLTAEQVGCLAESSQDDPIPRDQWFRAALLLEHEYDHPEQLFDKMVGGELTWRELQRDHRFFEGIIRRTPGGAWRCHWGS